MDIVTKQFKNSLDQMLASAPDSNSKMEILNMQSNVNKNAEATEATSSAGSGQYSAPLFSMFQDGKKKVDDETPRNPKSGGGVVNMKEDAIEGGLSDNKTLEDIAKKHDKKGYYDIGDMVSSLKKELNKGIKVEMEHTDDVKIAKEIAMDHLYEDPNYYSKLKKIEAKEATGASSAGSYESPAFLAKSTSKKNWRGAAKPLYKGGKFVRVKEKCKKFPYCNQGDINALQLWEDDVMTEAIKNVAKNKKIHENVVRAIVLHVIEEQLFND